MKLAQPCASRRATPSARGNTRSWGAPRSWGNPRSPARADSLGRPSPPTPARARALSGTPCAPRCARAPYEALTELSRAIFSETGDAALSAVFGGIPSAISTRLQTAARVRSSATRLSLLDAALREGGWRSLRAKPSSCSTNSRNGDRSPIGGDDGGHDDVGELLSAAPLARPPAFLERVAAHREIGGGGGGAEQDISELGAAARGRRSSRRVGGDGDAQSPRLRRRRGGAGQRRSDAVALVHGATDGPARPLAAAAAADAGEVADDGRASGGTGRGADGRRAPRRRPDHRARGAASRGVGVRGTCPFQRRKRMVEGTRPGSRARSSRCTIDARGDARRARTRSSSSRGGRRGSWTLDVGETSRASLARRVVRAHRATRPPADGDGGACGGEGVPGAAGRGVGAAHQRLRLMTTLAQSAPPPAEGGRRARLEAQLALGAVVRLATPPLGGKDNPETTIQNGSIGPAARRAQDSKETEN